MHGCCIHHGWVQPSCKKVLQVGRGLDAGAGGRKRQVLDQLQSSPELLQGAGSSARARACVRASERANQKEQPVGGEAAGGLEGAVLDRGLLARTSSFRRAALVLELSHSGSDLPLETWYTWQRGSAAGWWLQHSLRQAALAQAGADGVPCPRSAAARLPTLTPSGAETFMDIATMF